MQDQNMDIRCGLILNIQVNKSVINEYIYEELQSNISNENYEGFEYAKCGDNTYEDMFMEEFKSEYINRLNQSNNCSINEIIQDIIAYLVLEYLNKNWIIILYGVSDN